MSRKHYVAVAAVLAGERAMARDDHERRTVDNIARSVADVFKQDNGRFDRQRFYAAVGMES